MPLEYARLFDRVIAAIIDSIVLIGMMYGITEIFSNFENIPTYARITAFVFIFVLYDPLFTAINGGTIGHTMSGIGVRLDGDHSKNISFPVAIGRFVLKFFLGWFSLLSISGSKKKQAMHDTFAKSVVLKAYE